MKQKASLMLVALTLSSLEGGWKKSAPPQPSALERYAAEAKARAESSYAHTASPGSLFGVGGHFADLARDRRAYQIDDLVTIVVSDTASAVARGVTSSSRKSSSTNSITALAGALPATSPLANLATFGGDSKLDGSGQTSRSTQLNTTLSARVAAVLPNGNMILEGVKEIAVNSERQTVIVRGVCRPQDLTPANTIRSEQIGQLEVHITGKGVVGDAIRRPFILYRILQGLMPF